MATKSKEIVIKQFPTETIEVTIAGDGDLILSKMSDKAEQDLIDQQTGKAKGKGKEAKDRWECLLGGVHWMDGPETDYSEEGWEKAMKDNRVGYVASGIKKGICDAVVRVLGESKSTIANANIQILPEKRDLVPIQFANVGYEEKIISNWKGQPLYSCRNIFNGWSCTFKVRYTTNYTVDQIVECIQAMGFSNGIGAHRVGLKGGTNGMFHVEKVTIL